MARFSSFTRGFRFQATQDQNVTALGVYDVDLDGLTLNVSSTGANVGLWDDTGTLLGDVSVPGGTNAPIIDGFRYAALDTPVGLTTGSFYRVGANTQDIINIDHIRTVTADTLNGIDTVQSVTGSAGGILTFPSFFADNPGEVQLGGMVLFGDVPSASVPFEFSPAMGLLLAGGLLGGRQLQRRRQAKKLVD